MPYNLINPNGGDMLSALLQANQQRMAQQQADRAMTMQEQHWKEQQGMGEIEKQKRLLELQALRRQMFMQEHPKEEVPYYDVRNAPGDLTGPMTRYNKYTNQAIGVKYPFAY